ncbi:Hsp70 family protein [Clostridium sp. WILCCON 0269]|uniref:Chaperone protein DnaK n=1 Tax=Candidatus Clostridium eludens TaxID=3381663 RepID=A0ABW8SDE4_9CLOT
MPYDSQNRPVIGIDLGTTFSAISSWTGQAVQTYSPRGSNVFQSVVYFDERSKEFIYDTVAFNSGIFEPANVCIGVKRLMDNKDTKIKFGDRQFSPIDVSAMILKYIYTSVQNMFPQGVYNASGVVVTVPYYFKANQLENTSQAAKKAGLNLVGIIQEPIAAALAYGCLHSNENTMKEENILVFDLGGGTFDLTIFRLKEDRENLIFEVLGIGGDDRLGGMDFDNAVLKYIIETEGIDFQSEPNERLRKRGKQALMAEVIKTKETLSFTDNTYMAVLNVIPGVNIDRNFTRDEFEDVIQSYYEKVKNIIKNTLNAANIKPEEIDKVIKVGGSSKIPIFDNLLNDIVGKGKVYSDIDPSLCVSQGAAIYAAYLTENLNTKKKIVIIPATAHALGVEDARGRFVVLIHENRKTPAKKTLTFYTDEDNCTEIDVQVYQGNHKIAKENAHVGTVHISGLIPSPKRTLEINITFEVKEDQIVTVTVEQKESEIRKTEVLKLY